MQPSTSASEYIRDGWFSEVEALWPGQKFSLAVEEVLLNVKTEFQVSLDCCSLCRGIT